MKRLLIPTSLMTVLLVVVVLPQSNAPLQKAQQNSDEEELNKALRLKQSALELYNRSKYGDALPPAKRALEIELRLLGPTHQRVAVALNNLAEIYSAMKRNDEAEKAFQDAVAIFERDERRNAVVIGKILGRLAELRLQKKDYVKAESLLERSLTLTTKIFGSEDTNTAERMFDMAVIYQRQKQYGKAEPLFLQALKLKEKLLGASDPNTVKAMKHFACATILNRERSEKTAVEPFDENMALRSRAICWLGELEDNCADAPGNQFGGRQDLVKGKAVRMGRPAYPAKARDNRASGTVVIAVLLDESGNVVKARGVCGAHHLLVDEALEGAFRSKFTPTIFNGTPIQTTGILTYNFVNQ
jgi:TonB family protein